MAEARGELELYNQWFSIADLDRDGVLSGPEAVQFFLRSGLSQHPTLFKIWQHVAGDAPTLGRKEFYTAMKLVSLAQMNNGFLDDTQAMRLVNGLAGPVRIPQMQGMPIPKGLQASDSSTSSMPSPRPVQSPARPGPPHSSGPLSPGGPGGAQQPAYPPLSAEQASSFQTAFTQLDRDQDGYVQGVDCFGAFMQSGLPKEVLKSVWDLVAGDAGQLSRHQFLQALYLIDCVKRGIQLPSQLLPGQFPPVAGSVNISQMTGAPQDIYQASLAVPPLMPRAVYQPPASPPSMNLPSQVPALDAGRAAALEAAERARLEAERDAALKQEQDRRKAEEERAAAQAKRDFYTSTLAELRLAQSKVTRALVEAQQRCEMEKAEAERMEGDYNRAYAEFSVKHAQNAPMVEALKKVQEEKAALSQKLDSLRGMIEQLESVDTDWESREKGECEELNKEIAAMTVRKAELQVAADAVERRRGELVGHIQALKAAAVGVEGGIGPLKEQVDKVAAEASKEGDVVVGLLKELAPLYNTLYDAAKKAMVPLPAEAVATIKREPALFKYDDLLVAGAENWGEFQDEGYKIVSALPADTRLTTFTSPSLIAAGAAGDDEEEEGAEDAQGEREEGGEGQQPADDEVEAVDVQPEPGVQEGREEPPATVEPVGGTAGEGENGVADGAKLGKQRSTVAEEMAQSAAAEAGVLASAIAEALSGSAAGSKPGSTAGTAPGSKVASKAGSLPPSKQGSTVVTEAPFAVAFEDEQGESGAVAPPVAVSPAASADAFVEGFGSITLGGFEATQGKAADAAPTGGGGDQAGGKQVPAARAPVVEEPAPASAAEDWTSF